MNITARFAVFFLLLFSFGSACAQKVGVVLSGGGANGLAHIGVLRALEEYHIPVDYIAGTSMGAIVGGLYAAGYSPSQIETMLTSEEFLADVQGEASEEYVFFLKKAQPDAYLVQLKVSTSQPLQNTLPTHIVSPFALDYKMVGAFGGANALARENFDSLFVPFRCLATNPVRNKVETFSSGPLNVAIRASSTYPFYFKPITVNGELLFDGGMLNNFPADIMIREFHPDVIIGSNVSYNYSAPDAGDVVSQIKNMLVNQTDYSLRGQPGVIINPPVTYSAFDFSDPAAIIAQGYQSAIDKLDSIRLLVGRSADSAQLQARREKFNAAKPPIVFEEIVITGLNTHQGNHIRNSLVRNEGKLTYEDVMERYLRLFEEEQISYIYPAITYNRNSGQYILSLHVEKQKEFFVKFGGNFSSKPINTGYVSLKYHYLRRNAYSLEASSYFGKYYGSLQLAGRMQTAWNMPVYFEPFVTINRWDYFKSRVTFFEENRPSFIIQEEKFAGLSIGLPVRYKSKMVADYKRFEQECSYYLTEDFTASDTADRTRFFGNTAAIMLERNTLNRKQYASKGTYFKVQARYFGGKERTIPGSTAVAEFRNRQFQDWLSVNMRYDNYFKTFKNLTFGFHLHANYNTNYLFSNYKASLIFSPAYQPVPESRTLFLDNYRANKFVGSGMSGIVNLRKNFEYRLEAYLFQPINELEQTELQDTRLGSRFRKRYKLLSTSLIYHTPIGPLSATFNYYDRPDKRLSFILNFGYVIFNRTVQD